MNLRQGYKGEEVSELQRFLNESFSQDLNVDGHFGPATTEAVKKFQLKYNLTPDGIFGQKSYLAAAKLGFVGGGISKPAPKPVSVAPPKSKTIVVSAGHTNRLGQDRGVAGNGYVEGVEAVKIRDVVAAKLRLLGHKVREDGEDGESLPLKKALALIPGADIAVEFHFNAGPPSASGIEVLSMPDKKAAAQRIAQAINKALNLRLRGEAGWKDDTSGQHPRLAFCRAGGLVIEICFMSSSVDMEYYSENFTNLINNLVEAIAA